MSDKRVKEYVASLEAAQRRARAELTGMTKDELQFAVDHPRFYTVRRMLLLLNTHLREHTTQLVAARDETGAHPSMPQRMLARLEEAQGDLLGAIVGLSDEDLDLVPEPGEWSAREILDHLTEAQGRLLDRIVEARERAEVSEKQ